MKNNKIKLGLENFRIFTEYEEFEFAPFTILTGPNNSGKSTLHKALYLMSNSFKKGPYGKIKIEDLCFDEISDKIGNFASNLSYYNKSPNITITFGYKNKYLDENFKISLKYDKGTLFEVNTYILKDKTYYGFFTMNNINNWAIRNININVFKYLLKITYEKGIQQNRILELCKKLAKKDYTLTKKEEQEVKKFEKKGLILLPDKKLFKDDDEYYLIKNSLPFEWFVYDNNNKKNYPYYDFLERAYKNFSTPFDELLINSDFLHDINEINYFNKKSKQSSTDNDKIKEISSILLKENIFTKKELIEKYQEFETQIFISLINYLNRNFNDILPYILDFSFTTFIQNYFNINKNGMQWNILSSFFKEKSPFVKYIFEKQNWGYSLTAKDFINGDLDKKIGGGRLNDSLDTVFSFLHIFWEEFITNLDAFIKNTKLLFFDTDIKRHLLFDTSTKYQSTLTLYAKHKFSDNKKENCEKFIHKWLRTFHLGTSIYVEPINAGKDIIGAEFFLEKNDRKIPLGDNGMGTNQLLLLILQLATSKNNSRFLLEEPEASLHPAFQSKLSEMFADAFKTFGHTFVIETHSEYLVRKFQFLTARKVIAPDDTQIYYFHHPDFIPKNEKQIKKLFIRPDGIIDDDFGTGFFDESTRLTLDLLKLQNRN